MEAECLAGACLLVSGHKMAANATPAFTVSLVLPERSHRCV